MKILNIEQKTPEWYELRRNSIGASEAPIILGISPYRSPLSLWEEKLGLIKSLVPENEAMRRGNEIEIIARDHYNLEFHDDMHPVVAQSDEYPFLIASLDGMNSLQNIMEIKYNKKSVHEDVRNKSIFPDHHYCQMQQQMLVTNQEECTYVSANAENDIVYRKVLRSDKYIDKMIDKLVEFWDKVQRFEQPSFSDRDLQKRDDTPWRTVASSLLSIRKLLEPYDILKKQEEDLRKQLILLSNGRSSCGCGVKLTKVIRNGTVDWEKMCNDMAINPDKLNKWRKPSVESWRLTEI
jgi:putative phage-type endonuclease